MKITKEERRNKKMADQYLTLDFTFRKLAFIHELSPERVRQILAKRLGEKAMLNVKNMRKQRVAERIKENYLKNV